MQEPKSPNSRLMVYVRVKPLAPDQRSIIDIVDGGSLIFDPIDSENEPTDEYYYHGRKFKSIGAKRNKNTHYSFDKVFDQYTTNYHIYETVTRPMVDATINGLNCSVFAYGATGSGKTHTMLGSPSHPGVIYFTSKDLFGKLSTISESDPLPAELRICYFEIYNEKIRDLLVLEPNNFIRCGNKRLRTTPERCRARQQLVPRDTYNLPVCDAPGDGQSLIIPDLSYHTPSNADQLIELLEAGNANRSQHPTDANADSSRSHAIFQIVLTRRTRRLNTLGAVAEYELQTSKMSLIDLAGSERASVAYRAGNDRSKNLQREGGNINKSLLALGNCINALADPKKGHKHIPYRNSKLTRLLRDSLGGRCRTAMIATVCQQPSHYDDSQNTLVYASRAKCIKLRPGRNFTEVNLQPKNYNLVIENQNKQITLLQSQNAELKIELEELKNQNNTLLAHMQKNRVQNHQTFLHSDRPNYLGESYRHGVAQIEESSNQIKTQRVELEELKNQNDTLRVELEELKNQNNTLRAQFQRNQTPQHQTFIHSDRPDSRNFLEESRYKQDLEDLCDELGGYDKAILEYESKYKMSELKLAIKELDMRAQGIHSDVPRMNGNTTVLLASKEPSSLQETDQSQALKAKQEFFEQERSSLLEKKRMTEMRISDVIGSMAVEFELKGYGTPEEFDKIIEPYLREKERCLELEEKKFSEQHAFDMLQECMNRLVADKSLLVEAANVIRYTHAITKGRGLSETLEAKQTQLLKKLEGKKKVIWKDDKYALENDKDNKPLSKLLDVHNNLSLNYSTPFKNNNTLHSRRLSRNLVSLSNYTPEQSNITFDASQ